MRGRSCGFRPPKLVSAGKPGNAFFYQELLRQHVYVVPLLVQRMNPDGKYIFQHIQCWLTLLGPPSSCWQNSGLRQIGRYILAYSAHTKSRQRLKPIWLLYICPLPGDRTRQRQNSSARPASHSAAAWRPLWPKIGPALKRRAANSLTYTYQPFQSYGTKSFQKGWVLVLIDWEKKQFSLRLIAHLVGTQRLLLPQNCLQIPFQSTVLLFTEVNILFKKGYRTLILFQETLFFIYVK